MKNEVTITGDINSYLSPGNFEHYYRIANMMSKSEMVPKNYKDKPQDILLAMEYGRSLNLGPLQAIQNIAVINGRPSLYGDAVLAVCSGHPEFENIKEEKLVDKDGGFTGYKCSVKRKGRDLVTKSFTIADATTAGLWKKSGPWMSYPDRMIQMRARGFALRDSFADALGGVRMAEEVLDYEIKDINQKTRNIKEDLKEVIDKNKNLEETVVNLETGEVIESEEIKVILTPIKLDEIIMIKDIIKDNKVDSLRVNAVLQTFNVTHVEQLSSEHVDDCVARLLG